MSNISPEQKCDIIRRPQEVLGDDAIGAILAERRHPKCCWGTVPTGRRKRSFHVVF
ncbi:hypothetical protein JAAARDRAFT_34761 [Jaapia argillacea MUCL 33604]|uniref:Uncharacterized protein n=1 Tax=Jaapia argillacea MUCL 33604 TaxID=933084 RepID=A0A067PTB0_9AGAM|nr:hypothetical protein JAAARDRAFT_34761 [Jaapia argillacea MUCL 33604]